MIRVLQPDHLLAVAICLLAPVAESQHVQWETTSPPSVVGGQVVLRDFNGDGEHDIASLVPMYDPVTGARHEEVWILSGRDGSWLPDKLLPWPGDDFDRIWALGDTNGDGHSDFLLAAVVQGSPRGIHAICGLTLQPLYSLQAPAQVQGSSWGNYTVGVVVGNLDVDADGLADCLVTDPRNGIIYAYDHTGAEIYSTSSPPGATWQYVGIFEDHDGDGHDDYLTTVYEWQSNLTGAEIISGATGQPIFRVLGPASDYLDKVTGCGDLDGDGKMDILLGGGNFAPGTVQAYSSVTGQQLWAWYSGYAGDYFGQRMLGTVDIDQDGIADPIATSFSQPAFPRGPNGYISIFNGRDGSELRFSDGSGQLTSQDGFGPITAVPSRPGSSLPRFLAPAITWSLDPVTFRSISKTFLFEAGPDGASTIGSGCAGTLPVEPRMGLRQLAAGHARVMLSGAPPGALGLLALGIGPAGQPVDLSGFGFTGCSLHAPAHLVGVVFTGPLVNGQSGVDSGYAFHDFAHDFVAPSAMGTPVVGQFVVLGSGQHAPGGATAALQWFFQ